MIPRSDITGLVLAGGRGSRMNGADKGLEHFNGMPLAQHALRRLAPQVGTAAVSANRNLGTYASFGVPVWTDTLPGHEGPLAGLLAGLSSCETRYLVTVPCDTPFFSADLVARLADALERDGADIAMAAAPDAEGRQQKQPVFSLVDVRVRDSLARFVGEGGRKVGAWAALHRTVVVDFAGPEGLRAFSNANTAEELRALEAR